MKLLQYKNRKIFCASLLFLVGSLCTAQEWYEPSLTVSNLKADTAKSSVNLKHLLIYYQRLAESEPQLWVSWYYQSYINLKLAMCTPEPEIQGKYLEKAYHFASICLLNFNKNTEVKALYAIIVMRCMQGNILEKPAVNMERIGAILDTLSDNPRMLVARSMYLLPNADHNPKVLSGIESNLRNIYANPTFYFRGSGYCPSWGYDEIGSIIAEIEKLKNLK